MRPMTEEEQRAAKLQESDIRRCLLLLTRYEGDSEDVDVAIARLANWIAENAGRWVR